VADTPHLLPSGQALGVAEYLQQWLSHVAGRVRPKTLDGYRGLIRLYALPALGAIRLEDLGPPDE
jgi:hypothetical protein